MEISGYSFMCAIMIALLILVTTTTMTATAMAAATTVIEYKKKYWKKSVNTKCCTSDEIITSNNKYFSSFIFDSVHSPKYIAKHNISCLLAHSLFLLLHLSVCPSVSYSCCFSSVCLLLSPTPVFFIWVRCVKIISNAKVFPFNIWAHNVQMNILEMVFFSSPFHSSSSNCLTSCRIYFIVHFFSSFSSIKKKKCLKCTQRYRHTHWKIRAHCMPSAAFVSFVWWWKKRCSNCVCVCVLDWQRWT